MSLLLLSGLIFTINKLKRNKESSALRDLCLTFRYIFECEYVWSERLLAFVCPSGLSEGYSSICSCLSGCLANWGAMFSTAASALKHARKPPLHYASVVHTGKNNLLSCVNRLVPHSLRRETPLCMFVSVYCCKRLPQSTTTIKSRRSVSEVALIFIGSEQPITWWSVFLFWWVPSEGPSLPLRACLTCRWLVV